MLSQPVERSPLKLLVVEDEGLIALDISRALNSLGHQVLAIASSADEAMQEALRQTPDLVLMDIQIRGAEDGIMAAERLRKKLHLPVVFLTAHSDRNTLERVKEVDPFGFIIKPFTPASLNVAIEMALVRKNSSSLLHQSNESLLALNDRLTRLSYSLSHDLREPLRSVSTASDLLAQTGSSLDADTQEYIDWITDGCNRMNHLITSLLDYYRDEAGYIRSPQLVPAAKALEEALEHLQASLQQADANIQYHPLPDVVCHPVALVQVFQNLILNALQYRSERQPEVFISAHREKDSWIFAVSDNGMGFPPSRSEAIFDLLDSAAREDTSRQDTNASSLGLALCRRIVEQYGGVIWAESSPGYGSTFFFTLPADLAKVSSANAVLSSP